MFSCCGALACVFSELSFFNITSSPVRSHFKSISTHFSYIKSKLNVFREYQLANVVGGIPRKEASFASLFSL